MPWFSLPVIRTILSICRSSKSENRIGMTSWGLALAALVCATGHTAFAQAAAANFGPIEIGSASPAVPMVLTFAASGTLASAAVLTQGSVGLDFSDAGSDTCTASIAYTAGQTCTVNVIFTPRHSGNRFGAVALS